MSAHDRLSPDQNKATDHYLHSPAMLEASKSFDARAKRIHARHWLRHNWLEIGASVGAVALIAGLAIKVLNHADEQASRIANIQDVAANCVPVSNQTRQLVVNKTDLPSNPTDIDIARVLAARVPGAKACDGTLVGTNQYLSFIALLKVDQVQASTVNSDMPPLTTSFTEQGGGTALFVVPTAINSSASS